MITMCYASYVFALLSSALYFHLCADSSFKKISRYINKLNNRNYNTDPIKSVLFTSFFIFRWKNLSYFDFKFILSLIKGYALNNLSVTQEHFHYKDAIWFQLTATIGQRIQMPMKSIPSVHCISIKTKLQFVFR